MVFPCISAVDMNSVLSDVLLRLCATAAKLTDRFAMEHAMCVAVLHSHIGQDVGGCGLTSLLLLPNIVT